MKAGACHVSPVVLPYDGARTHWPFVHSSCAETLHAIEGVTVDNGCGDLSLTLARSLARRRTRASA